MPRRRGLSAHVIEAHEIGHGGSGRNVGLVNAGVWMPPAQVRAALGPDYGPRFLRRFADGPAMVFDLIERHQIRCEATRAGTIHAAHAASGLRDLEGRLREWAAMGEPVRDARPRTPRAEALGTEAYVRRPARSPGGHREPDGLLPRPRPRPHGQQGRDQHRRAGDGAAQAARRMAGRDRPRARSARAPWCWAPTPIPTASGRG